MSSLLRGARACLLQFTGRLTLTSRLINTPGAREAPIAAPWLRCISYGASQNQVNPQHSTTNYTQNAPLEPLSPIERQLEVMDSHARWRGRIDREDVEEVLNLFKTEGKITEQQSLMLLRCTGALMVKESPEDRLKIFSELWNQLKVVGVPLRTSHFNASLRVQLENKVLFSPTEMLAQMETSPNTKPNRITFQLLVARFCEEGDIEGATKVLEHMKNEKMSINETVFNSLVKGHMKNGDIQGARNVLDSMRSVGVDPTADTYCLMMCCQAEKGDIDGLKQTKKLAQEDEVMLLPRHFYAAVMELADHGFKQDIPEVLGMLRQDNRLNHDTLNCMHQLLARGHDEMARLLLDQLNGQHETDNHQNSGSRSLLRDMVLKNRPVESIEKMLDDLRAAGKTNNDMGLISIMALQHKKPELALNSFECLKKMNHPVRPHFFWPIFIMYHKAGNKEGIYTAAGIMTRLVDRDADIISSLYVNVFKPLQNLGEDPTTIVTKLQEQGITMEDSNSIQLLHLISIGKLTEAATLVETVLKGPSQTMLRSNIMEGLKSGHDLKGYIQLMSELQKLKGLGSLLKFNGDMLQSIIKSSLLDSSKLTELVQNWVAEELTIGGGSCTEIKDSLLRAGVSSEVVQTLTSITKVTDTRTRRTPISSAEAMAMSVEDLEVLLEERSDRKTIDGLALQKCLLTKYCSSGNVEKANELKAKLDGQGFIYRADMLRRLALLAARDKKDLNEALKYKEELEAKYPEFQAYTGVTLNIATLQIEQGKTNEALETLRAHANKHQLRKGQEGEEFQFSQICIELIEASRKQAGASYTEEVVSTLFDGGYIKAGTYSLLEQVMRAYVEQGDVEAMMTYFEQCHVQYGRTPIFSEVFKMLIKLEDAERLQKAVDMVTTVFGEMPVLHHLVINFIECGKVKQARKILDTPGLRAVMAVLQPGCDRFINMEKEKELKQLVDMTRDVFAINRDEMLFSLIRLYARQKEPQKVMDMLATYEDEGCVPTDRTLRYVAKVLQSSGQEVPFTVPEVVKTWNFEELEAANSWEEECLRTLKAGDISAVLEHMKSTAAEQMASPHFLACVASYLLRKVGVKDFKHCIYLLGEQGQCAALEILQTNKMSKSLVSFVGQQLLKALIYRGQASELFDDPRNLTENMTIASIQLLAERHPDLLTKLEMMVDEELAKPDADIKVANQLFNFYILSDHFDKANGLLEKNSYLKAGLRISMVASQLRRQENEAGLLKLLDTVANLAPGKRALVFSQLVSLRTNADDTQGALHYLQQSQDNGLSPDSLWPLALNELAQKLIAEKKHVPFEVKTDPRRQDHSSSAVGGAVDSSSDSSDSDDEQGDTQHRK